MAQLAPTVPDAYAALMAIFNDVADQFPGDAQGGGLMVVEGTPVAYIAEDFVQLSGVTYRASPGALGNLRRDEEYDIHCLIRCHTGDVDAGATNLLTMRHAWDILDAVQTEITADPNVNYLIRYWQLSDVSMDIGDDDSGWAVDLTFDIHAEATTEQ